MENQEAVPPAAEPATVSPAPPALIPPPPPQPPPVPAPNDPHHLAAKQTLQAFNREVAALKQAASSPAADLLADWLGSQCLVAARHELAAASASRRWNLLRSLIDDCVKLRRSDQYAARLQLLREKLELRRSNTPSAKEEEFKQRQRPKHTDEFGNPIWPPISPETLASIRQQLEDL